jgi:hypothetical protein
MKLLIQLSLVTAAGTLLIGCATPPNYGAAGSKTGSTPAVVHESESRPAPTSSMPAQAPVPSVVAPAEPPASEKSLAAGLASFERGEYVAAMRQLSPLTTDTSLDIPNRLRALKSLAFSQCLTGAVVACRGTFERAFKLDPKFDLAPAEQGHPVWGPQFDRARKNLKTN